MGKLSHGGQKSVIIVGMDLANLVNEAKKGNKDAFSQLFTMYYTPLYRYTISRSGDENLALDITQDVFLRWYESLDRYELPVSYNETSPLSYLFTIAKRLLINNGIKKSAIAMPEDAAEFFASGDTPADTLSDIRLGMDQINVLMPQLTDSEREFIELKYMSELENKEIAVIMEKSVDALRQIEHRAIKKLRNLYENATNNTK